MDRHHDLTTREYNRRLARQERTTRKYISDHYTIRTDRRVTLNLRLFTIRGIEQSSPNLRVKTKKEKAEITSVYK